MFIGKQLKNVNQDMNRERDVNEGGMSEWKRRTSTTSSEGINTNCQEDTRHNDGRRQKTSHKNTGRITNTPSSE